MRLPLPNRASIDSWGQICWAGPDSGIRQRSTARTRASRAASAAISTRSRDPRLAPVDACPEALPDPKVRQRVPFGLLGELPSRRCEPASPTIIRFTPLIIPEHPADSPSKEDCLQVLDPGASYSVIPTNAMNTGSDKLEPQNLPPSKARCGESRRRDCRSKSPRCQASRADSLTKWRSSSWQRVLLGVGVEPVPHSLQSGAIMSGTS